jgi:hypothetical protein
VADEAGNSVARAMNLNFEFTNMVRRGGNWTSKIFQLEKGI